MFGKLVLDGEIDQRSRLMQKDTVGQDEQRVGPLLDDRGKRGVDLPAYSTSSGCQSYSQSVGAARACSTGCRMERDSPD